MSRLILRPLSGTYSFLKRVFMDKIMPQPLKMDSDRSSEPDSTTVEKELLAHRDFAVGDDVLCRRGDQHYFGTVVEVNNSQMKCLVKFFDNTEIWCTFKDMKFLDTGEQEVTCVLCKTSHNKPNNQLKVCSCGRGYHQLCHQPQIPSRDTNWSCRICSPSKRKESLERDHRKSNLVNNSSNPDLNLFLMKKERQKQECSCGKKGVWYRGMLQCRRCRHWFHASCVTSLDHKVFWGDRFYVMICKGCNVGNELCVRLAMAWPELVHLVLFNLMLLHHSKYFDLDLNIMPYINRHWPELKLMPELANMAVADRRVHVIQSLIENDKRFQCGREIRKKNSLWALREKGAPKPPTISLPPRGVIDMALLRMNAKSHLLMPQEQPLQNGFINSSKKVVLPTARAVSSSRSTSPDENRSTDFKVASTTTGYVGCGLVKRSVPFPLTEQPGNADTRFRNQAVRKAARTLRKRKAKQPISESDEDVPAPVPDTPEKPVPTQDFLRTHQELKSVRKDPSPKPEVRKRPQRNLLEARLNSTESKLYNPQAIVEEAKRKSAPSTESSKTKRVKKGELKNNKRKLVQKTILETLNSKKWRSEEKPPDSCADKKDNHHDSVSSADENSHTPIKTVITKRQLSAKDIVVDQHGQVKRRRRHRKTVAQPLPGKSQRVLRTREVQESVIKVSPEEFDGGPIDMEAVQELFGISNRVTKGERYRVLAKRVGPDGKVEALIEFLPLQNAS